jgi:hypothetical protein
LPGKAKDVAKPFTLSIVAHCHNPSSTFSTKNRSRLQML